MMVCVCVLFSRGFRFRPANLAVINQTDCRFFCGTCSQLLVCQVPVSTCCAWLGITCTQILCFVFLYFFSQSPSCPAWLHRIHFFLVKFAQLGHLSARVCVCVCVQNDTKVVCIATREHPRCDVLVAQHTHTSVPAGKPS